MRRMGEWGDVERLAQCLVGALLALAASCKPVVDTDSGCVVSDISIAPLAGSVPVGGSLTLQAVVTQTGCSNPKVFWSSNASGIATVSQNGIVTGVTVGGPAMIAASVAGKSGTSTVTVVAVPVATVEVTGPRAVVLAGRTLQLTATPRDTQGNALKGRSITWRSSDPSLASVSNGGLVTGVAVGGPVTITAVSEGKSGALPVTVMGRMAYTVITDPGSPTPAPVASTSFNSSGLPISVTRSGTGLHAVTFEGQGTLAGRSETVVVDAIGSDNSSCAVGTWTTSGANLHATVQCVNATGARQDTPFAVLLLGNDMLGGRTAFARANNAASSASYSPPPGQSYNPTGKPITITRTGAGHYDVTFTGDGRSGTGVAETILVSPVAADVLCQVDHWTPATATISVACNDALGLPRNAQFTVALVDRGRAGTRVAYALVDCGSGICGVPSANSYSSGGPVSVIRSSAGVYRVTFADLARAAGASDAIFVSAVSAFGGLCKVVSWANALNGRDLEATVQCFGFGLTAADLSFDILLIQ